MVEMTYYEFQVWILMVEVTCWEFQFNGRGDLIGVLVVDLNGSGGLIVVPV